MYAGWECDHRRMGSGFASAVASPRPDPERLLMVFMRTAEVLEQSAVLADEHAQRCEKVGRHDRAAEERRAARRARDGADRARSEAGRLAQLRRELDQRERRADERDRIADERERVADERERIADDRDRAADELEARLYAERRGPGTEDFA